MRQRNMQCMIQWANMSGLRGYRYRNLAHTPRWGASHLKINLLPHPLKNETSSLEMIPEQKIQISKTAINICFSLLNSIGK